MRERLTAAAAALSLVLMALAAHACGSTSAASRPLDDGFYVILAEAAAAAALEPLASTERVVIDDGRALAEPRETPPRWLRVRAEPDVPLVVETVPAAVDRERAHPSLRLTLAAEHTKRLEQVTTQHLGGSVALVVGGEVMTTHHIRAAIRDGRIEITRCHDDACERILVRLQEKAANAR